MRYNSIFAISVSIVLSIFFISFIHCGSGNPKHSRTGASNNIKKHSSNKKAQVEIIGLVIIVVLISLGMLFMAIFTLKNNPQEKIFTRKGLAYSTMSTIMKTTISDCSSQIQGLAPQLGAHLIEDCAEHNNEGESYVYPCRGVDGVDQGTCLFLNTTIYHLLSATLGTWNKNYEFSSNLIPFQGNPVHLVLLKSKKGCPGERDSSGLFPLHSERGFVENVLYVCD